MNSRSFILPTIIGVGSFALGYAGKLHGPAALQQVAMSGVRDGTHKASDRTSAQEIPHPAQGGKIILTTERSTDTVETLLAVKPPDYGRIAAWLVGASEEDLAAYWQGFKEPPPPDPRVTDWIFIVWSRLDPQKALAAVQGSGYEAFAWQGWAEHDPRAALQAALPTDADGSVAAVAAVATGIGKYHPEWLRIHYAEIPEAVLSEATMALSYSGNNSDPLATLEFYKKLERSFDPKTLQALADRDPLAAYRWFKDNGVSGWPDGDRRVDALTAAFTSMAASQPEALQTLAEQTPAGADRRKMEAALFKELAGTDPQAALAQARSTKAPRIAAERLAVVGNELVKSDPNAALAVVSELFSALPDAYDSITRVENGNSMVSEVPGVKELLGQLVETHPAELLDMPWMRVPGEIHGRPLEDIEYQWATQDLPAYTAWATHRSDPAEREGALAVGTELFINTDRFSDAVEWLGTAYPGNTQPVLGVLLKWDEAQPGGGAVRWLESSTIPEEQKQELRAGLEAGIQKRNAPEDP